MGRLRKKSDVEEQIVVDSDTLLSEDTDGFAYGLTTGSVVVMSLGEGLEPTSLHGEAPGKSS